MPSARIHEAIARKINKDYKMNDVLLRIGTVSPDSWRNVETNSGVKDKYLTHFWNFRIKNKQATGYQTSNWSEIPTIIEGILIEKKQLNIKK